MQVLRQIVRNHVITVNCLFLHVQCVCSKQLPSFTDAVLFNSSNMASKYKQSHLIWQISIYLTYNLIYIEINGERDCIIFITSHVLFMVKFKVNMHF